MLDGEAVAVGQPAGHDRAMTGLRVALDAEQGGRALLGQARDDGIEIDAIVARLPEKGPAALFCVERDAEACHRWIVAGRLAERYGFDVEHLTP